MKKILFLPIILLAISMLPVSFAWDGSMAMDADKRNVALGQIITYQGYLYGEYPLEDEDVSITVYEKETRNIILNADTAPGTKSVKYFENTAWPFTFKVDTIYKEFSVGNTYVVEATYDDKSTRLEFFIQSDAPPSCFDKLGSDDVIVFTDKQKYDKGDVITITGCLSKNAFTKTLNVSIYDPNGKKIGTSTISPDADRTFADGFIIDEKFGVEGTYSVEVDAGGLYSSSKSFVVPEFGEIAIAAMVAAVALLVMVSSRYTENTPNP